MSEVPTHEKDFLNWAQAAVEESDSFLRSQPGYDQFQAAIDAIDGLNTATSAVPPVSPALTPTYNYIGKVHLDNIAAQTDIKPFWDYSSKNPKFQAQAELANKLAQAWWMGRHVTLRFADVIQYCQPMGTGYAHQVYNPQRDAWNGGYQGGDMELLPEDPRDVLPIRPGSFLSTQECFGVIVRRERSVNWIKAKYGSRADGVKADRDNTIAQLNQSTRFSRLMTSMGLGSGFMENLFSSIGMRPQARPLNIPSADLYHLYVNDDSINTSGVEKWMGLDPITGGQTNWTYRVPYIGQLKPDGGAYREDDPEVRLYPRKRHIVFTKSARIYDDTSIYWHGMFPLVKLTLDPRPWMWLGKAPLKDLLPLHTELQKVMRTLSKKSDRLRKPGAIADKNAVSQAAMDRIDTEREGLKLRFNPAAGKGVELIQEQGFDQGLFNYFDLLKKGHDELGGVADMNQLVTLGQLPQLETMDRLIAMLSSINRLRSLVIEAFMSEFAIMLLMNFFQFYTRAQRIAILGPQGQTFEDFDFDPDTLIPDMMSTLGPGPDGNPLPRYERAREFYRYFTYQVAPGSLLNSASIQDKMMYVMLMRAGAMDIISTLEKLNVPNLQVPADWPSGVIPRLAKQMEMGMGLNVGPEGRKASGQNAPRVKMSESG